MNEHHEHSLNGAVGFGRSLKYREAIDEKVVYPSSDGTWQPVPAALIGTRVRKGRGQTFARPATCPASIEENKP